MNSAKINKVWRRRVVGALKDASKSALDTKWVALTGGPCSGKSTVLSELARRGWTVREEQARARIEELLASGLSIAQVSADGIGLANTIFRRNVESQEATPVDQITCFDRSLPDVLAFSLIDGVDPLPYVHECGRYRFASALVFEYADTRRDSTVYHSREQMKVVTDLCAEFYAAVGTRIQQVPLYSSDLSESVTMRVTVVEQVLRCL